MHVVVEMVMDGKGDEEMRRYLGEDDGFGGDGI